MASRPITRVDRKTFHAEETGCSSEGQHAQNGWRPYPRYRSCRHFPAPSVGAYPLPELPPASDLFDAFGSCYITLSSVMTVRDGPGPDQPRLRGNLLVQEGSGSQLREIARSEWTILPVQQVAAYPWSCQSASSSARAPVPRRVGSTGPMSDGAHGMVQDAQSVSLLRIRVLRLWKGSNPAQHDVPIDGLFSFTFPCAALAQGSAKSLLSCRDRRNLGSWIQ